MIATQYKIILPGDYNMEIVRERVKTNGYKTDGFEGLKYKLYLITEKGIHNNIQNSYCPFYLWGNSNGLNKFLFRGFYDNIISSFGWQKVNVGIPLIDTTTYKIKESKYLFEISGKIEIRESLNNFEEGIVKDMYKLDNTEYVIVYNPEKWEYSIFYFIDDLRNVESNRGIVYNILHISEGN